MKLKTGILLVMGFWFAACSPEADKQYVQPYVEKTHISSPGAQYFGPAVDILFVVDNSGSMNEHQKNLAKNIALFTDEFSKSSILNFNIGVVTTDMSKCWYPPCDDSAGYLIGKTYKVVSNSTPSLEAVLAENIMVGISGSVTEMSFAPVVAALSPALAVDNAGFYRPKATLVVIFITDAEDQSSISAKDFYEHLLSLKQRDTNKVLGYGVIVPSPVAHEVCARDERDTKPVKIETFLGRVENGKNGDNIFSLCDVDYGMRLAGMAKNIVEKVGSVFYLQRLPDFKSIQVTYGNAPVPMDPDKGWMYDAERNAVVLGRDMDWDSQPHGSRVEIYYEVAKLDIEE